MTIDFTDLSSYLQEISDLAPEIDNAVVRAEIVPQQVTDGMSRLYLKTAFRVNDEVHQFNPYLGEEPNRPQDPNARDMGNEMIQRIQAKATELSLSLRRGVFT